MTDLDQWWTADLLALGMAADEARRLQDTSSEVTFLRVHVVTPSSPGAASPYPDAATEIRAYEAPATLELALEQIARLKQGAGPRRVVAYSMADVEEHCRGSWGPLPRALVALAAAGWADVAELPVDRLHDPVASMRALRDVGIEARRVTVADPVGPRAREILQRMRACRACAGAPLYFAPLPHRLSAERPTTGYEDLRLVALARLALAAGDEAARVAGIEVDWMRYGPKLAQVALTFGANHLDAVEATSDPTLGKRRETVEVVERNIRAAGFEPREWRGPR
ncbi:MAG: hypothetical protein ACT4QD_05255 [Acidobacteriota bacterium]